MVIMDSQKIIDAARACIDTPFHHQGRVPGTGLDCIGLVVVALSAAGMDVRDRQDYSVRPDGNKLVEAIVEHGGRVVDCIAPADILLFRYDGQPQHVAIATSENTMIHSFAPVGRVVETSVGAYWKRRLLRIYRFIEG